MSENVADPTGLGLLGLAVVCFVVSTSRVGWSAITGVWLIQMGSFSPEIQKGFDVTQLAFAFVEFLIFSIFGTIAALKTNKVVFAIMVLICFLFFGLAADLFLGGRRTCRLIRTLYILIRLLRFRRSAREQSIRQNCVPYG